MVCDFVIATERAKFGIPEIDIGITPGWGGTQRLARLVGRRKVKEIVFTGGFISAQEALRLNLINRVVPVGELEKAVNNLVDVLLTKDPVILKMGKLIINKGIEADLGTALTFEALSTAITWQTEAKRRGCHSFLQKTEPWIKAREAVQKYFEQSQDVKDFKGYKG
jgi:enoyl-CoA hydratase